jgi:hypothetical protein
MGARVCARHAPGSPAPTSRAYTVESPYHNRSISLCLNRSGVSCTSSSLDSRYVSVSGPSRGLERTDAEIVRDTSQEDGGKKAMRPIFTVQPLERLFSPAIGPQPEGWVGWPHVSLGGLKNETPAGCRNSGARCRGSGMRAPENLYRSGLGVDQRIERTDAAPSACLAVRPRVGGCASPVDPQPDTNPLYRARGRNHHRPLSSGHRAPPRAGVKVNSSA